jgi:hypothetical protein
LKSVLKEYDKNKEKAEKGLDKDKETDQDKNKESVDVKKDSKPDQEKDKHPSKDEGVADEAKKSDDDDDRSDDVENSQPENVPAKKEHDGKGVDDGIPINPKPLEDHGSPDKLKSTDKSSVLKLSDLVDVFNGGYSNVSKALEDNSAAIVKVQNQTKDIVDAITSLKELVSEKLANKSVVLDDKAEVSESNDDKKDDSKESEKESEVSDVKDPDKKPEESHDDKPDDKEKPLEEAESVDDKDDVYDTATKSSATDAVADGKDEEDAKEEKETVEKSIPETYIAAINNLSNYTDHIISQAESNSISQEDYASKSVLIQKLASSESAYGFSLDQLKEVADYAEK